MNILITGGAGFIGSHLIERLSQQGDRVLALDDYATARRDSLTEAPGSVQTSEASIADGVREPSAGHK